VNVANETFRDAKERMDAAWHKRHDSVLAESRRAQAEWNEQSRKENEAAFAARQKANKAKADAERKQREDLERRIDPERKATA
jgi:hypothetical protein